MLILKVAYKVCIPTDIDVSLGHQARHSGGPANIDRSRAHSLVDEVPLSRAIFAVPPTPRDLCQSTLIGSGQRDVIAVISRSAKPRCSFRDWGGVARARIPLPPALRRIRESAEEPDVPAGGARSSCSSSFSSSSQ